VGAGSLISVEQLRSVKGGVDAAGRKVTNDGVDVGSDERGRVFDEAACPAFFAYRS